MSTSSTGSRSTETTARKLRSFLDDVMTGAAPPICRRIRALREERFEADKTAAVADRRSNRFSQEAVAGRVGVTLKAYRAYEAFREPDHVKRRAIARALELDDDYFEGQFAHTENEVLSAIERLELAISEERALRIPATQPLPVLLNQLVAEIHAAREAGEPLDGLAPALALLVPAMRDASAELAAAARSLGELALRLEQEPRDAGSP